MQKENGDEHSMKSPEMLSDKLARQWQNPDLRERRLLCASSWPIRLTIGKPSARMLVEDLNSVRRHLAKWRKVDVGRVHWKESAYRSIGEGIDLPVIWELETPSQWIQAANHPEIFREYQQIEALVAAADPMFHAFLIRQRRLVWEKPESDVMKALTIALKLAPGCARGVPLRAFSIAGSDTKFFERNRSLMIRLLDIRFDGAVSDLGLEHFLDALDDNAHWLLLADLDGALLPFDQQRVRASDLIKTPLPAWQILVVENEKSLYQLPSLKGTIGILGSGMNLSWMNATWLNEKKLAYWGDLDTWGLVMLATARRYQPDITQILMTLEIFEQNRRQYAVSEPQCAGSIPPKGLTMDERRLYEYLLSLERGRLEQEFIHRDTVLEALMVWFNGN